MDTKAIKQLSIVTLLGVAAANSQATTFRDLDTFNATINKQAAGPGTTGTPFTGIFDIVTAGASPDIGGFSNGGFIIDSAVATFNISADGNFVMSYNVLLDGFVFEAGSTPANGAVVVDGDGAIDGSSALETSILAALQGDGQLTYSIYRTDGANGTLKITSADLVVTAHARTQTGGGTQGDRVPDGGATAGLLGLGMLAVGAARKLVK